MKKISLIFLSILFLLSSAFGMSLSESESKVLKSCLKKSAEKCRSSKDKTSCYKKSFFTADKTCQALMKRSTGEIASMGSACLGVLKICPIPFKTTPEDFKKMEECIKKNIDRMPKSCVAQIAKMSLQKNKSGKSLTEVMKEAKKQKKSGKNIQIKNK